MEANEERQEDECGESNKQAEYQEERERMAKRRE
jgi:hypothetical protein